MAEDAEQPRYDRRGALAACALLLGGVYAGRAGRARGARAEREAAATLRLYNWPDYVSPRTYAGFTKATGVNVAKSYYASNQALLNRLTASRGLYDIAVPTGYMVGILAAQGLLQPIDWKKLPTVKRNIDAKFLGLPYDPKNRYSVPKDWGTTGFIYRTDKIKEQPTTWRQFFSLFEKYPRKFTLLDGADEVIGSIAVMMGYSYNTDSSPELNKVRRFLIDLKPYVHSIDSARYKFKISKGRAYGGLGWNGDGAYVIAHSPRYAARYVVPEEGGEFWVDAYVIPKGAHRAAAHSWIDFVYRPRWAAEETSYTYYGSPLARRLLRGLLAPNVIGDPSLFPPPGTMRKLEAADVSAKGMRLRQRIWNDFRG